MAKREIKLTLSITEARRLAKLLEKYGNQDWIKDSINYQITDLTDTVKAPWRKVVSRERRGPPGLASNFEILECGHERKMKDGLRRTTTPEDRASKRRCEKCLNLVDS